MPYLDDQLNRTITFVTMEQEYKMPTGTRIFYGILATGMFTLAVIFFTVNNPSTAALRLLFGCLLLAVAVLLTINFARRQLLVSEGSIIYTSLFSTKQLAIAAVKGYRMNEKSITIESIPGAGPGILIGNYADFKNSGELAAWFKNNFKDLDAMDLANEREQLLQNKALGNSAAERLKKFRYLKTEALLYNITGGILGLLLVMIDSVWSNLLLLAFPLSGILIIWGSKGTTKFISNKKKSVYSQIIYGFLLSSFGLFARSCIDYTLETLSGIWWPAILTAGFVFTLLAARGINRAAGSFKLQVILLSVVSLLYGVGSVVMINCAFDDAKEIIFGATVLRQRASGGKDPVYFLTLSAWGPRAKAKEIKVDGRFYSQTITGDTVLIKLKPGVLHIPWFTVSKK